MLFATKKKVFTVIEMLIVIWMIAWWLLVMYGVISYWINFVDYTRKKLIAINLAREWMETVYNIRDTNWTRWSWKRDKCWLKIDPLVDNWSDWCENDIWFQSGHYILKQKIASDQKYWILSGVGQWLNIFDGVDNSDLDFALCLSWWWWEPCPWQIGITREWRFFREIRGLRLVNKKDNGDLSCSKWTDSNCWDSTAKEFRFCSIVQFIWNGRWQVKMCWVLTNFRQ